MTVDPSELPRLAGRMTVFGILYLLAFTLVLSLVGYDLVMAADPTALANAGVSGDFSYVSTAGGAFLEWLEGKTLPGVQALQDAG